MPLPCFHRVRLVWSGFSALIIVALLAMARSHAAPAKQQHPAEPFVRRAHTGHVSNYDEAKVGSYELPPLLVTAAGDPVRDVATWESRRRPEILDLYQRRIFGRVPASAPQARAEVVGRPDSVERGTGIRKHVVVHFGPAADGPSASVVLYLPAGATKPVPALLQIVFNAGLPGGESESPAELQQESSKVGVPLPETGPVGEILRRGYAYATFRYTDVQPDNATTYAHGVEALAYDPGQKKPAPGEWGTITAWAWAASRVLDYLQTDPMIDGTRVALIGHSRLGKTALWASALDSRFALVYANCSGEMGAALSRRDYGETIDDMAEVFPYWFAGNFQRFAGHWNDMPVDAHMLIALSAPRPVFINGGTEDQWADPKGEFLAEVAAGPVYRLYGKADLGATELPARDQPLISGSLGWLYHTGPHAMLPEDWSAFLDFADRHLKR
jgi:hypothetical protein